MRLPGPEGRYRVGTRRYVWIDSSRGDPTLPTPGGFRQLIVQLWYPIDRVARRDSPAAPYMMELAGLRPGLASDEDFAPHIEAFRHAVTGAVLDAPLSPSARRYPLVLFSHGLGAPRAIYTTLLMRLASAGYIVAAIDHPGMGLVAFPHGRLAEPADPLGQQAPAEVRAEPEDRRYAYWLPELLYIEADQRFVLDRLSLMDSTSGFPMAGRLELGRVAMIGHSRGFVGGTCAADRRIAACVSIEGDADFPQRYAGVPQPFMAVRNPSDTFPSRMAIQRMARVPSYDVLVHGANHNSVTDLGIFGWRADTSAEARATAARRVATIARYVLAFLDETLRAQRSALLHSQSASPSEVTVTRFGH